MAVAATCVVDQTQAKGVLGVEQETVHVLYRSAAAGRAQAPPDDATATATAGGGDDDAGVNVAPASVLNLALAPVAANANASGAGMSSDVRDTRALFRARSSPSRDRGSEGGRARTTRPYWLRQAWSARHAVRSHRASPRLDLDLYPYRALVLDLALAHADAQHSHAAQHTHVHARHPSSSHSGVEAAQSSLSSLATALDVVVVGGVHYDTSPAAAAHDDPSHTDTRGPS